MTLKRYGIAGLLIIVVGLCCQSCKKGCTDPTAMNYNRSAKIQDGSCLYCDSMLTVGSLASTFVDDNNSSSPFFDQEVIGLTVSSSFVSYNGNACQMLGHAANPTGCVNSVYTGSIQNQLNVSVTFSGTLEVISFPSTGETVTNYNISNVTVGPLGTVSFNIGSGGCLFPGTTFEIEILSESFTYH